MKGTNNQNLLFPLSKRPKEIITRHEPYARLCPDKTSYDGGNKPFCGIFFQVTPVFFPL